MLKRYKKLGGEIITVGADAHKPEHVGYDFNIVDNILEACGFKYYAEFIKLFSILSLNVFLFPLIYDIIKYIMKSIVLLINI